jgi:hypothetical protein
MNNNNISTAANAYRAMLAEQRNQLTEAFSYKDNGDKNELSKKEVKSIIDKFCDKHNLTVDWYPAAKDRLGWFKDDGDLSVRVKKSDADTPSSPHIVIQFSWYNNGMLVGLHGYKDNLMKAKPIDKVTSSDVEGAFEAQIAGVKPVKGTVAKIKEVALKTLSKINNVDITAADIKTAEADVDDAGITRILIPSTCVIYLLTNADIKEYEFGDSDNEDLFSVGNGQKLVVVAI